MNLFAYSRDPGTRIIRFSVSQEVQAAMTAYLTDQMDIFNGFAEEVEFDGKYKPDAGEMLFINAFDSIDDLATPVLAPLNIPVVDSTVFSFDSIKALFFGRILEDGSADVYFQNFDRRRLISDAGFSLYHSQGVYKKFEGTGLTLDTKIAAKLTGTKLQFSSFFSARQIFDMTSYFQEATDSDIQEFARLEQVVVPAINDLIEASDSWVRRKLWLVRESGILERVPPNEIRAAAAEFGIPVTYETVGGADKLVLPTIRKDLKTLLRFLDDDYYKSPLSQTNYLTNSKRVVGRTA